MNYESVSNFEINKRVAIAAGLDWSHEPIQKIIHVHSGKGSVYIPFSPCSNPSDAWPIIMENLISIDQHHNGSYIMVWGYSDAGLITMQCLRKDALRTAMIVFLKMMGVNRG